jgi:hypothetical protein
MRRPVREDLAMGVVARTEVGRTPVNEEKGGTGGAFCVVV